MTKDINVNTAIRAPKLRLIDEDGNQLGVVSRIEALEKARAASLDLVEISPTAVPPVCKIMDYGKYKFMLSKKQAVAKKQQKQIQLKEIKFRPVTDVGDYQVKMKKISEFLERGDRVKVTLRFRGREMMHDELGMELMQRLKKDLDAVATVESEPKLEGRQMVMLLVQKKTK